MTSKETKLICCECHNEIEGDRDLTCDYCLQPMCRGCYEHCVAVCTSCYWQREEGDWDCDDEDEDE